MVSNKLYDVRNTLRQHLLVGAFSIGLTLILHFMLGIKWSTSFARVSFILLFLTLIIGPLMRFRKPTKSSTPLKTPWSWRGELGIWFTLTGILHFYFAISGRLNFNIMKALGGFTGGGGFGFANFIGLVALIWAVALTITSFNRIIKFLGIDSWKWFQSFTYVVFYLVSAHLLYFQFFTIYGSGPDWFGYLSIVMMAIVVILQMSGFVKAVREYRKEKQ
ncbi:MAG: hypothetical protein ABEK17_03030 [Candidatus Aenigmatarchaeota archaeon]